MKLRSTLLLLFAVTISVHGQSPLQQLATEMPKCSLQCFMKEIPLSSCAQNLTSACLCSNTALNAAIGVCAKQSCTNYELLQTKNVSSKGCGVPIRNKGEKHTIVGIVGFVTAFVAYALRLSASLGRSGRQLSWDDATMGVVVLLAAPLAVLAPLIVENGLGQDIWTLKPKQITDLTKLYFVGEILYILIIGLSKISILFFYLRVFPARQFRNVAYGVMGLCGAYTISFFFATLFQCSPINLVWTKWDGLHKGRCNDVHAQTWSAAGISIFLDIVIMIMPLKQLADLQMSLKKKVMVMSMFSVGIFVIVVAIIRLETLIHFAKSQNLTWDYAEAGTWSLIEVYVSIICGCMPALRMLLAKAWPRIRSTFNASKGSTGTGHSGLHSGGGANTNGTGKAAKITVKPKTGDESDFVPLVNIDNPRGKHDASDAASEKAPSGWIMRTSSVELLNHSNTPGATNMSHDSPHTWDMDKPAKGKEHV